MDNFGRLQLELLKKLENKEMTNEQAQFAVENYWVGGLKKAVVDGDVEEGSLMAGQSVGLVEKIQPMKKIIQELVNDAEKELQAVKSLINK